MRFFPRLTDTKEEGRAGSRGIAVVMAMSVMLLLMTVALNLHLSERANLFNAAALRDRLTLEQMAASGVNLATAVLVKDRLESETDSLQEDWADHEALSAMLAEIPFEQGKVDLKIGDETGKIQINALVKFPEGHDFDPVQHQLWEQFMAGLFGLQEDLGDTDAETIINSIKDWLDSGDDDAITGLSGAESDYYKELDPPYACKNGPFDDLSEIRLVKGITPQIISVLGGAATLGNYMTVYGASTQPGKGFTFPGKININTAELPVLSAILPPQYAELAKLIVEYRQATSGSKYTNDLTNVNWYKNVPGLAGVDLKDLITVSSDTFRITAAATLNGMHSTSTVVVQREKDPETGRWRCKVLNWKNE